MASGNFLPQSERIRESVESLSCEEPLMSTVGNVGIGQSVTSFGTSYPSLNAGASVYAGLMNQYNPGYTGPSTYMPMLPNQFNAQSTAAPNFAQLYSANAGKFNEMINNLPQQIKTWEELKGYFTKPGQPEAVQQIVQGSVEQASGTGSGQGIVEGAQALLKSGGSKEILKGFGKAVEGQIKKGGLFGKFLQKLPVIGVVVSAVNVGIGAVAVVVNRFLDAIAVGIEQ